MSTIKNFLISIDTVWFVFLMLFHCSQPSEKHYRHRAYSILILATAQAGGVVESRTGTAQYGNGVGNSWEVLFNLVRLRCFSERTTTLCALMSLDLNLVININRNVYIQLFDLINSHSPICIYCIFQELAHRTSYQSKILSSTIHFFPLNLKLFNQFRCSFKQYQ